MSIVHGNTSELVGVIAQHASEASTAGDWRATAGIAGLLVANTPLVIPFLQKWEPERPDAVLLALKKFRGDRTAEGMVLRALSTNEAIPALSVLAAWHYALPESEIRLLLSQGTTSERLAAVAYAATVPRLEYRTAIRALINDPDPSVSAAARRAEASFPK